MNCDICGCDSPSVHLTEIVDGKVRKLHLCADCAEKSGVNIQDPTSIPDILLGLTAQAAQVVDGEDRHCTACHMRWSDYKKSSRLGCPACYVSFNEELQPLLAAMHKGIAHKGKASVGQVVGAPPAAPAPAADPSLVELKQRLEAAIAAEDYEEAARVRDRIQRAEASPEEPR